MRTKKGTFPCVGAELGGLIIRVLGGLELLSMRAEESLEPMAEQVRDDVLQMVRILERERLMQALQADEMEPECFAYELREILESIPKDAGNVPAVKGYRLETAPGEQVLSVCDRDAVKRMTWCLIGARAAAGSRHITLDTNGSKDSVYITVTGDGADPEKNGDKGVTQREDTARALAALQGGSLTVRNTADGVCAEVCLPPVTDGAKAENDRREITPGIPLAELELAGLEAQG